MWYWLGNLWYHTYKSENWNRNALFSSFGKTTHAVLSDQETFCKFRSRFCVLPTQGKYRSWKKQQTRLFLPEDIWKKALWNPRKSSIIQFKCRMHTVHKSFPLSVLAAVQDKHMWILSGNFTFGFNIFLSRSQLFLFPQSCSFQFSTYSENACRMTLC